MPPLRISPLFFSVLQWLSAAAPLVLLLGLLAAIAAACQGSQSFWESFLKVGFYALMSGGIALMYLGWWLSMSFRGIVPTPRQPWEIDVSEGRVLLKSKRFEVQFPVSRPRDFVQVWDGGFDQLKGMEDRGLVVDFGGLLRVVVPGSSLGFDAALAQIQKIRAVRFKEIE